MMFQQVKFEDFSNSNRISCRTIHCSVLDVLPSHFIVSLFVFWFVYSDAHLVFKFTTRLHISVSISYWFVLNVLFSCLIFPSILKFHALFLVGNILITSSTLSQYNYSHLRVFPSLFLCFFLFMFFPSVFTFGSVVFFFSSNLRCLPLSGPVSFALQGKRKKKHIRYC